jgi:phage-related protein
MNAFPTLTVKAGLNSTNTQEFNVLEFQAGDGYTQTVPWGINHQRDKWQLTIGPLKVGDEDYQALETFLNTKTLLPFTYEDLPFNLGFKFGTTTKKVWMLDHKGGVQRTFKATSVQYTFTIREDF